MAEQGSSEWSPKSVMIGFAIGLLGASATGVATLAWDLAVQNIQLRYRVTAMLIAILGYTSWWRFVYIKGQHRASKPTIKPAVVLLAVSMLVVVLGVTRGSPDPATLSWYEIDSQGVPKLSSKPLIQPFPRFSEPVVKVPIRFAITNVGEEPIERVSVEIAYPAEYKVIPTGDQRIDPSGKTLIYEHPIEDLSVGGGSVIMPESDQIVFRAKTYVQHWVDLYKGRVVDGSAAISWLASDGGVVRRLQKDPIEKSIPLRVTVFSEGRKLVSETMEIRPPSEEVWSPYAMRATTYSPRQKAVRKPPIRIQNVAISAFRDPIQPTLVERLPSSRGNGTLAEIAWSQGVVDGAMVQFVGTRDGISQLFVDVDRDGWRDWAVVPFPGRSTPGYFRFPASIPMTVWTKLSFECDQWCAEIGSAPRGGLKEIPRDQLLPDRS